MRFYTLSSTSLYSITLCRMELTDDIYDTVEDTPQDNMVINLSSICPVHLSVHVTL